MLWVEVEEEEKEEKEEEEVEGEADQTPSTSRTNNLTENGLHTTGFTTGERWVNLHTRE